MDQTLLIYLFRLIDGRLKDGMRDCFFFSLPLLASFSAAVRQLSSIEMDVVAGCWYSGGSGGAPILLPHYLAPFLTSDTGTDTVIFIQIGVSKVWKML